MKKFDLSISHTNCLYRLAGAGAQGLNQMELVRLEMMDASQVSRVMRELIDKGYVKLSGEEGRYRRRYLLTEKGAEIAQEVQKEVAEIQDYVSGGIPESELRVFYKVFQMIYGKLLEAERVFLYDEDKK